MKNHRFALLFLIIFLGATGLAFFLHGAAAASSHLPRNPFAKNQALLPHQHLLPHEKTRLIITFYESANLARQSLPTEETARRTEIIARLQATAVTSQQAIYPLLHQLQAAGHISRVQPFWISNIMAITADNEAAAQLAAHPAVAAVRPETTWQFDDITPHDILTRPVPLSSNARSMTSGELTWGVSRIRANYVWDGLGIDGSGITVAIMDSGVDWQHPDLLPAYRGNLGGGVYQHEGNWYHAVYTDITEPIDSLWHGTHVAGTAVGQNGIGVAPGAQWIAVSIADNNGTLYESAIHAGFQWLLAPAGDPALAPDIINCSWGSSNPYWDALISDINALETADIISVFSAGNSGPFAGTINSPASYTNTLAVAASDEQENVAWFSSRGPSPLTNQLKPHIAAPGTHILSAYLNDGYAYANGTSMAAPHVSGALALLLSANPSLSKEAVWQRLADTAVPINPPHPNDDSGWGRLDAYTAVLPDADAGTLQGTVRQNGLPLPGVVLTITNSSGQHFRFDNDEAGSYQITLLPGSYTLDVSAFGYHSQHISNITLLLNQTVLQDFNMVALPSGSIQGTVREVGTNTPITATLSAEGTPITAVADTNGQYALTLPAGDYHITVSHNGHRLLRTAVTIPADGSVNRSFQLTPAPTLLLVDAGQWYYNSQITPFQNAIADLRYVADLWTIRNPYSDIPPHTSLAPYDYVMWADPDASPGYVSADYDLTEYMDNGGRLLVSGQNVALYDDNSFMPAYWWYSYLHGTYLGKMTDTPLPTISGVDGTHFAGLTMTLAGPESDTAQIPDRTQPAKNSLTTPILRFSDGDAVGLQAGLCEEYRIVYFGFGLEGVTDAAARSGLLERSFTYFQSDYPLVALQWHSPDVDEYAIPGQAHGYWLTLANHSETLTDTFNITTDSDEWATSILTPTMTLGPCTLGQTAVTVTVPSQVEGGMVHEVRVTAVSNTDPTISDTLTLRHQTPNDILLVDDDRWYEYEERYMQPLANLGVIYDVWDTTQRGSPALDFLRQYDMILWFTGYDWFQPITAQERANLETYLSEGGRLFLSSQDYLYYNRNSTLSHQYLGALTYDESITPTQVYVGQHPALPDSLGGPYTLNYGRAKNFSDSVLPASHSEAIAWNEQGSATALATSGMSANGRNWRTIFWSLPFEFLTDTVRSEAMQGMMGWLSDLGETTFEVDQRTVAPLEWRTYTLTVRPLPNAPLSHVTLTNTIPPGLSVFLPALPPDVVYDPGTRTLTWAGVLQGGDAFQLRYQALLYQTPPAGTRLENRVTLTYDHHQFHFDRTATVWVDAPDLSGSWLAAETAMQASTQWVTYTLFVNNTGVRAAEGVTAVLPLPPTLIPLTQTLTSSAGETAVVAGRVTWHGDVAAGEVVMVSLVAQRPINLRTEWLQTTAVLDDHVTNVVMATAVTHLPPYTNHLPIIRR
ncbi:MAG: S8 family serine peptidase [Ardenticatenaceae bacterium]|nr:S8 family serine peptidase [Anaerolineales bacterium]MCB8922179.1 S8 family serine peptidase [Ardenticatenaceae bacterium]MCB8991160.1 S8 family serine peptidase [Ardenticatenaceae bacterium]